ncbi:MAG TPA: NAD(+) diphosphatase [Pseudolabrys sp.]|nr:NAD(+) diphosphatase [Pseudolabrys sp.]
MSPRLDLGPKPHLGYIDSRIDRAADRRTDEAAIAAFAGDPRARAYVIGVDWIVMKAGAPLHEPSFPLTEARKLGDAAETVFLGLDGGAPRFGIGISASAAESLTSRAGFHIADLRSIAVQGLCATEHLPAIAEAKAILHWHARHRYCANCGALTVTTQAGWRRDCPQCKALHFPRTDPVVIMLAIDHDHCLLGRSPRFAPTMWSCLAGFIEPGESIEEAVRRETLEEAGIATGRTLYFRSQPWPFPMTLMIGCFAEALSREIKVDRTELEGAAWFSKSECEAMLARRHPDGLTAPPPVAIAYHIVRAWVDGEIAFG